MKISTRWLLSIVPFGLCVSLAAGQDCGGSGSPMRVFAISKQDPFGQATVSEVDLANGTFNQVFQTATPLTGGRYEPTRDRLYFGSNNGGIYRVSPDGSVFEEIVAPFTLGSSSDSPVFDAAGDLYVNTSFVPTGIWKVSPPDPGGVLTQVVPPYSANASIGLDIGAAGTSAGGLLGVSCCGGKFSTAFVALSNPPGAPVSTFIDLGPGTTFAFDLKVRPSGNILISLNFTSQILEYDSNGNFLGVFADASDGLSGPSYMQVNSEDDSVVVSDINAVHHFDAAGTLVDSALFSGTGFLEGLVIIPSTTSGGGSSPVPPQEPSPPLPRPAQPSYCPESCEDCEEPGPGGRAVSRAGNEIMLHSGEVIRIETDFVLPCVGPDLIWRRTYRSQVQESTSPCGTGWTHTNDEQLLPREEDLILSDGSGTQSLFEDDCSGTRWV
ncbi:MAG: DUF6531 domain-containing protein, partial [Planctomycetota bacterium]|nr:DUF6531 domain-containing protein [Planctomycetota bacterium]